MSKADRTGGGASQVAETLTHLLAADGHHVEHFVAWHAGPRGSLFRPLYGMPFGRLFTWLHRLSVECGLPELVPWELLSLWPAIDRFDLVHFHDISSAVSPLTIRALSLRRPVVWTFHDCSPFTGGCIQPIDCVAFRTSCGPCPRIGEWPLHGRLGLDFTRFLQSVKRSLARSRCYTAIAPSNWMAETVMSSGLLQEPPLVISNCVDTETFHPRDRTMLRRRLGLPEDRVVLLLAAGTVLHPLKGASFALEASQRVRDLRPFLVVLGTIDDLARERLAAVEHLAVGRIRDPARIAEYFAASDALLCCSLADTFNLTALEAMASGAAVLGFATGGIPELVVNDVTGWLVPLRDVDELARQLRRAIEGALLPVWGAAGRARALDRYTSRPFLESHLQLYRRILRAGQDRSD